jgi:acetate---CoA ligase (ADP-forming)
VTLVCPVTSDDIAAALDRLRMAPLLAGFRGRPSPDRGAIIAAALQLQDMLAADPALREVEINPLMVRATGAIAADAVIWEDD